MQANIRESGSPLRTIDYSYNEAGELLLKTDSKYGTTIFAYCPNGNKIARTHLGIEGQETITTYSFDALGRLEAVSQGGRLLVAALYDADNNKVFTATRNPDPDPCLEIDIDGPEIDLEADQDQDTGTRWTMRPGVAASTETTRVATLNLDEDTTHTATPKVAQREIDLFWYGVAQGLFNFSHLSPYLTNWLNGLWTLEAEKIRTDTLAANKRAENVELLSDFVFIPDALDSDTHFTDAINFEDYTVVRFIHDTNLQYPRVLATYSETGEWTSTYTFGNGITGMNTPQGAETFFTDGRGSVSEAINLNSAHITTYTYDAFGNVEVSGNSPNQHTYNQEWFDFGSGLQYLRARYVDLELGRFVSRDSVLGTLKDPRTHNLYLYLQNDPLNNIDPSGHQLQMGTSGNQPASLWGNCTLCNNDGRNVPAGRTHCARCTRARIPTPTPPPQPVWVQPPGNPNPAAWSAPPSGGTTQASNNASAKAKAAEVKTNKKNSVNVPQPHIPYAPQPHVPESWSNVRAEAFVTIVSSWGFSHWDETGSFSVGHVGHPLWGATGGFFLYMTSPAVSLDDWVDGLNWHRHWGFKVSVRASVTYHIFQPRSNPFPRARHDDITENVVGQVRGSESNIRRNAMEAARLIVQSRVIERRDYLQFL